VTCPFARNDAAYVLGALEPEERHRYEEHLHECPSCSGGVRELAGLPGLLARLPADRAAALPQDGGMDRELPETLLSGLLRRVRRERRWARLRVGLVTGAVAASLAVGGTVVVQHLTTDGSPRPVGRTVALEGVGNHSVHGTVQLSSWAWGTTVRVTCHAAYSSGSEIYTLYVTNRAGKEFQVSSWRSTQSDVTVPGGIALPMEDVVAFRVKDGHQRVVMQGG
jgi:predicted anti-sigma-YlaC factor YlaD